MFGSPETNTELRGVRSGPGRRKGAGRAELRRPAPFALPPRRRRPPRRPGGRRRAGRPRPGRGPGQRLVGADRAASGAVPLFPVLPSDPPIRAGTGPVPPPETASLVALRAVCLGNHPRAKPERHETPTGQGFCRQRTGKPFVVSRRMVNRAVRDLRRFAMICGRMLRPRAAGIEAAADRPGGRMFGSPETNTDRHGVRAGPGPGSQWKFLEADRTEARADRPAVRPVRSRLDAGAGKRRGLP